ncbi:glycoside hydrolase family 61 protein [Flammula alnicola]|nr:glycoside hydrolase family 61 protein [Flammula alnicola]
MKVISVFLPLLTVACVSAHGFVGTMTINGKPFSGNIPNGKKAPSVIRQISTSFPNKGANNPALTCGPNSSAGSLVADANPSDNVTFDWKGGDLGNWPHNTGPMLTYMASCGANATCDKFNITNAKWFKIQQIGRKANSAIWAQQDLMTGGKASAQIPPTLAAGNYLIRHEIIALHLATSLGGAEFYPSCAQLRVGGNQTGVPKASDLVSIPGAYKDADPGIFDPNVFNPSAKYVFPGPAIATLVNGTAVNGTVNGTAVNSTAGNGTATTSTMAGPCSGMMPAATQATHLNARRPHQASRIMRRMTFQGNVHY